MAWKRSWVQIPLAPQLSGITISGITLEEVIRMKNGTTRCPECWEQLLLSDWDDPDVVVALHLYWVHYEWVPEWMDIPS